MVTYKTIKKVTGDLLYVKGQCVSSDVKPTTGIANGSRLLELDTGKRCVFDADTATWIQFGTGEDRSGKVKKKIRTIETTADRLFGDMPYEEIKDLWRKVMNDEAVVRTEYAELDNPEDPGGSVFVFPPMSIHADFNPDLNYKLFAATSVELGECVSTEYDGLVSDYANTATLFYLCYEDAKVLQPVTSLSAMGYNEFPGLDYTDFLSGDLLVSLLSEVPITVNIIEYELLKPGEKAQTEEITGPLSTIFEDNGYVGDKFIQLCEDMLAGKAYVSSMATLDYMGIFSAELLIQASVYKSTDISVDLLQLRMNILYDDNSVIDVYWVPAPSDWFESNMHVITSDGPYIIDDSDIELLSGLSEFTFKIVRIKED